MRAPTLSPSTSNYTTGDGEALQNADLTVANLSGGNVSVLLGDGKGKFGAVTNFGVGVYPLALVLADFDGDHQLDIAALGTGQTPTFAAGGDFNGDNKPYLVTVNYDSNTFSVFLNQSK